MILVTGATGNVGRGIVRRMTAAGHQVKALTRNPGAVFDGAEVVVGDLDEQRTLPGCLEGVNKAYVMGMGPRTAEPVATFVHAAAGLRHIVLMSSLSVELERGGVDPRRGRRPISDGRHARGTGPPGRHRGGRGDGVVVDGA